MYCHFTAMKTRILVLIVLMSGALAAQLSPAGKWAASTPHEYRIKPNIVYSTANDHENKLDLYVHWNSTKPHPVMIYIHGGGWMAGTKEQSMFAFLPYIEWGWDVVNVEYRLASVSLAPAAVEDCRCALRWVFDHAAEYNFDTSRVVVTGGSAGGHLALTTGMLTPEAGFDRPCYSAKPMKVAAIVNWFGITDVNDVLDGPNLRRYAVLWLGNQPDRERIAKSVSPMSMLRKDLPPIITIHGDSDPTVPYPQAVRLHHALEGLKVPNKLVTIPGGKHGGFSVSEMERAHTEIREFLTRYVLNR